MGIPDIFHDTRQIEGIFPIEDSEAAQLHDIGWSSGYGWRNEWDWWWEDQPRDDHMESRDTDETKLRFLVHIKTIRAVRNAADELTAKLLS